MSRFYDEDRAREMVDGYNDRLLKQSGAASLRLDLVVSPTSLALVGAY